MILVLKASGSVTKMWLFKSVTSPSPAAELTWASDRFLADQLLGRISDFTREHSSGLSGLTGILLYSGPGSFTSLRIGHATANALADSLAIPVASETGEDWIKAGLAKLASSSPGHAAMPFYGADANISKPKT